MNRYRRAISLADMDAYARSVGMINAAEYADHLQLHRRLDTGGRITAKDIERAHAVNPRMPLEAFNRLADWVNEAATGHDRADRYCDAVAHGISRANGVSVDHLAMREAAREQSETYATFELAIPLTDRLDAEDAHRDRQNGIDQRVRVEAAKRAALENPDAQRRADIAHEVERHGGSTPKFYARDRREILAQASDRIGARMMKREVRDADASRLPDRSDDRREDIGLAFDTLAVNDAARDELTIASNPLLESLDDAATDAEATHGANQ